MAGEGGKVVPLGEMESSPGPKEKKVESRVPSAKGLCPVVGGAKGKPSSRSQLQGKRYGTAAARSEGKTAVTSAGVCRINRHPQKPPPRLAKKPGVPVKKPTLVHAPQKNGPPLAV